MRHIDRVKKLHSLIKATRKTVIVDVGANPFNGIPGYALLRRSGLAQVIGFEPQPEALQALRNSAKTNDIFLPYVVGSGMPATLYMTKNSGLVSTLEPDRWIVDYLSPWWKNAIHVHERVPVETRRIDDIAEIQHIDFLKIDIQGENSLFFRTRAKSSPRPL